MDLYFPYTQLNIPDRQLKKICMNITCNYRYSFYKNNTF